MFSVLEDFRLNNWHETILLADGAVSGKAVGILSNSQFRRASISNLKNSSPFSKSSTHSVILSASLSEAIESLCSGLSISSTDLNNTSVDLNTAMNSSFPEECSKRLSILASISKGLVEHDDSTDVLFDPRSSEKKFSVCLSVIVVVFNLNSIKSLSNSSGGLIGGEDSLTWCANFLSSLDQLFLEASASVHHL